MNNGPFDTWAVERFFGPSCQMSSMERDAMNQQQAMSAQYLASHHQGMANSLASLASLAGTQNAYRPTVRQLSDWECERLGLPFIPEDTQ